MDVTYQPWSGDPHESDAGAVQRAMMRAARELAMADRFAADRPTWTDDNAEMAAQARHIAFFAVSAIAESDVCELDSALERGRTDRRIGETPDMAYARELRAYVGLPE